MSAGAELSPPEGNGTLRAGGVLAKLSWALHSVAGDVRPHNEDFAGAYAPTTPDDAWDRPPVFVVADGLGGHAAGEVASRLATEAALQSWTDGQAGRPPQALRSAVRAANVAVYDAALEHGRRGMGTTLTALTLAGTEAVVAHVGDSRAYLVRGDECTQLTTDHSRAAEMVRMKLITPEQAAAHPARSMLTRSLGADPTVQVDLVRNDLRRDDTFVLCSDGLWDVVGRADFCSICEALGSPSASTPTETAAALVDLAVKRGTADNVTALVVRVKTDRPIPGAGTRRSFFRRR
jgi:protein phosphatase